MLAILLSPGGQVPSWGQKGMAGSPLLSPGSLRPCFHIKRLVGSCPCQCCQEQLILLLFAWPWFSRHSEQCHAHDENEEQLTDSQDWLKPHRSLLYTSLSPNPPPSHWLIAEGEKWSPTFQDDHWKFLFGHLESTEEWFTLLPDTPGNTRSHWREVGGKVSSAEGGVGFIEIIENGHSDFSS